MRTVLRRGQRVKIYRPICPGVSAQPELEGDAVLYSLVRKCHTSIPPMETWLVKFDDDESTVQRDIPVKLSQSSGMASSLARSPESRNLLAFMAAADLSDDWADPSGHGVTAHISGQVLNNEVGAIELAGARKVNEEILVHLECRGSKMILNLNTLLVLASSYIRLQYDVASEAVANEKAV